MTLCRRNWQQQVQKAGMPCQRNTAVENQSVHCCGELERSYVHLSHPFFAFTHLLGGGRQFSTQFISSTLNFLLFLLKMCSYLNIVRINRYSLRCQWLILVLKNPYASLPGIHLLQKTQNSDGEDLKDLLGMEGVETFACMWKIFLYPLNEAIVSQQTSASRGTTNFSVNDARQMGNAKSMCSLHTGYAGESETLPLCPQLSSSGRVKPLPSGVLK